MRTSPITIWCLALLTGCAVTLPGGGGFTDATTPIGQRQYEVVGPSEATVFSTIFLWQFGSPDIEKAKQMAVARVGGDEMIDVTWEDEHRNYLLFSKLGVTVRGTVIKFKDGHLAGSAGRMEQTYSPPPPKRDHSITLALGALSTFTRTYYGRKYEFDYGTGWNITYKAKYPDRRWYVTPVISITSLQELTSVAAMGNLVLALDEYVPGPMAPYVEFGLGYTPTYYNGGDLEWMRFGWNAGIGATLRVNPRFAFDINVNRQSSIGGLGVYSTSSDLFGWDTHGNNFTAEPHFWKFGIGLVLCR